MIAYFQRVFLDSRGASAIEFALVTPIVLSLLTGAFGMANYLSVQNALNSAVDEASRYATLDPTPSDAQLKKRFEERLTRNLKSGKVTFTPTRGSASSTVNWINLEASYPVYVDIAFVSVGPIKATSEKRVYISL